MSTKTLITPSKPNLKQPPLYKVMILDDDTSTFQCVIDILVGYFNRTEDEAYELAFEVHMTGNIVAGIYPKDIAETKRSLAQSELKTNEYPLQIKLIESI